MQRNTLKDLTELVKAFSNLLKNGHPYLYFLWTVYAADTSQFIIHNSYLASL